VPGAKEARKTAPAQMSRKQATLHSAGGRDPGFDGGDGSRVDSDRKVQGLEAELQRQIREYREARESVSPLAAEPSSNDVTHVTAQAQTSRKQATLHSATDHAEPLAAEPSSNDVTMSRYEVPKQVLQFAAPEPAHADAGHKKRLNMKRLQQKVERVGANEARPISDNDNRLKDGIDIFEDASYLSPHKYHVPHLLKKMGKKMEEDVIAPWITGPDSFGKHTEFNGDGTIKTFHHYSNKHTDPFAVFAQNPTDEEPWNFAEGKHWDNMSPESKGFSHGEDWTTAGSDPLLKGEMTHGDNKKWADIDDPQWGFDHQFADWDPHGDMNTRLVWGGPAMKGKRPWEMTWMDPRLEGDDFVAKRDYLASMHPEFKNAVNNKFAHLDQEGKENKDLVFGDNEGLAPSGQAAIDEGKDDPASLRQHMDVPINDNWNFVSDSKVNSNSVKDLLVDRSAAILPLSGEPLTDALTGPWMGINGVGHSDETPGFAAANDYRDNQDLRKHHPMTAKAGGEGGVGAAPWGR
jgi:hypothetical protein